MGKLKRVLKKIFFLPPLPTVAAAVLGYASVLAVAAFDIEVPAVEYASYIASAYALIITITGLPHGKAAIVGIKKYILGHPLMKRFRSTVIGERFFTDIRFRTGVSLYRGFFINLLYIAMKLFSGIYYRSIWFIVLAFYYMLLALMRILLVRKIRIQDEESELRRYRLCGIMLLLMNQALAGIVILVVHKDKGFAYPGVLVYGMAFYAFYAVITAAVNIVRTRRHKSPVLSAVKAVNLVAAMVSILSLETAMLARFGGDDAVFRKTMTSATGGGVCAIVIGMAVFMIVRSCKLLKKLKDNNP
ncbi:MAG: hypothetical protein NC432_09485 [Roseburia sp.]|nr:hypothetical protein [Roseburia sp.]MCM1098209.1 hypothetical protein [Ruminococcus flavefaciens]